MENLVATSQISIFSFVLAISPPPSFKKNLKLAWFHIFPALKKGLWPKTLILFLFPRILPDLPMQYLQFLTFNDLSPNLFRPELHSFKEKLINATIIILVQR